MVETKFIKNGLIVLLLLLIGVNYFKPSLTNEKTAKKLKIPITDSQSCQKRDQLFRPYDF